MQFLVYLQEHADGGVLAQVALIPHLSVYDHNREQALSALQKKLTEHLELIDRRVWRRLAFNPNYQLRRLAIDLFPKGKMPQDPIPVNLAIVITTEEHERGTRYIVIAPQIHDFYLVVNEYDQLEEQTRAALVYATRKWKARQIVELGQAKSEALAEIEVWPKERGEEEEELANLDSQENVLSLCGLNLSEQAKQGRLGRAERREQLVERLMVALAAPGKSSVMLVGRADVGKTAILHEVVERMRTGKAPSMLKERELWFVTANNLIAGMKYTGEWQARTQRLIAQARKGRQILYMGDPNEILDAGRWSGSDNNMGRFLRPYLESGEITVICECSPESYAAALKTEPSFVHAFQRIDVPESDEADTQAILAMTARRQESQRNLRIDAGALSALLDLSRRFMPYRALPGKAVSLLDAMLRDALPGLEKSATTLSFGRSEAITSFARLTGLPEAIISDQVPLSLADVRSYFEERLLGQTDGVEAMLDLVTVIKAGLHDPNKPLGSFFFVGPTGVGKTELAKVLAEFLFGSRERLIRLDMGEYATPDAVTRLIGNAWRDEKNEGELTRRVREQPFSVVLFDELEKAHREVFDVLLGVLGEGRLTNAGGRSTDFRNTIIIMTSNLGASRREMQSIGFSSQDNNADSDPNARLRAHFIKEAERFFRPEFFNRIDRIVAFRPLSFDAMRLITRRELGKLLMREGIVRRNLLVEIDDAVIETLLASGFHPMYGARPLQREIERMVILPLARLLINQGAGNRLLRFSVQKSQINLSFVELDTPDDLIEMVPDKPMPDRVLETDLGSLLRASQELLDQSLAETASPTVQRLRRLVSQLLQRTHEPSFWDTPSEARNVLGRIYHLERVLKRLETITERAEGLVFKGKTIRTHRDRRSVPGFASDLEQVRAEFDYLQVELLSADSGPGHDQALLRISPLGRDSEEWTEQLMAMYIAWAKRKGYEYIPLDLQELSAHQHGNRRRTSPDQHKPSLLLVQGSNVYEFLRSEVGIHKLLSGPSEARKRSLARVQLYLVSESVAEDDSAGLYALIMQLIAHGDDGDESIIRVYNQGRHRFVRDARSGLRLNDLSAVLENGQIDPFLLVYLRTHQDEGLQPRAG
jgi:ATP-dependent Clp protease ATP-binding subunit ClpA/protein subunit release factor A